MKLCGREKCASKKGLISFHSKSKFPRVFLADNFKVLKNLSNLDNNEDHKNNSAFPFIKKPGEGGMMCLDPPHTPL